MIRTALLSAAATAFALTLAAPAAAQDFAVTNATVATGDGSEPVEGATVVVRGGKVVSAGASVSVPAGIRTIDGTGMWVTPGIVSAVTDLGLYDVAAVSGGNDLSASKSRFNAALDVEPAINPSSQHIGVSRAGGLTRAIVAPSQGNSLFAGQGAMIDLGADANAVVRARLFQLVDLGEGGAGLSGGSRTAAHVELRNALAEAAAYAGNRWNGDGALLTRADAQALVPVVTGEQKLFVEVERAADIRAVADKISASLDENQRRAMNHSIDRLLAATR